MSLTLVTGIPGSGKTTYAKQLASDDNILIDDPIKKPNFEKDKDYIITDPNLCFREVFDRVDTLYPDAFWVFILINPIMAWNNIQKRLVKEPQKIVKQSSFLRFYRNLENNILYYRNQTKERHLVREVKNVLVL